MTAYLVYRERRVSKAFPNGRAYLVMRFNSFSRELRIEYSLRGFAHVFTSFDGASEAARDYGGKIEATEIMVKDETERFASFV